MTLCRFSYSLPITTQLIDRMKRVFQLASESGVPIPTLHYMSVATTSLDSLQDVLHSEYEVLLHTVAARQFIGCLLVALRLRDTCP